MSEEVVQQFGRLPGYPASPEYDSQTAYGRKQRCIQYGCEIESLVDNNTYTPFTWDGDETFTLDGAHWRLISGNPKVWAAGNLKPAASEEYPYNGMGRVVIPKNMVNIAEQGEPENIVNLLTQDAFEDDQGNPLTNTVFVIQYDFTLDSDLTIPANCVLEFEGGSIHGTNNTYTITGNNTVISYYSYNILKGVGISGTFKNSSVVIDIFDDADWSVKMTKSVRISKNIHMLRDSQYTILSKLYMNGYFTGANIDGAQSFIICNVADAIEITHGTVDITIHHIRCRNDYNSPGTFLNINGLLDDGERCERVNLEYIDLHLFNVGIHSRYWRESSLTKSSINCKIGLWYDNKCAEIHVSDCMFNGSNAEGSKAIYCYEENLIPNGYAEGLNVVNCDFVFFETPIHLRDIYQCNISNCWIQGTNGKNAILIDRQDYLVDVKIMNSTIAQGNIKLNFRTAGEYPERIEIGCCTFYCQKQSTVFDLIGGQNILIHDCMVWSLNPNANSTLLNTSDNLYYVTLSNIPFIGPAMVINTNTRANYLKMYNVKTYNDSSIPLYYNPGTGTDLEAHNVTGCPDTPINGEVRVNSGVLQYWDGSTWLNVSQ